MALTIFLMVLLSSSSPFFLHALDAPCQEEGMAGLLPGKELEDWKPQFEMQEYSGDDLYLYINGGAEIYHEYGFDRVIVQDYSHDGGKSISLEIYRMSDAESAYGIFTFKTTANGKVVEIGDMAYLEDYYLNVWNNRFLVTLTGFDSDEITLQGLVKIASEVTGKIAENGTPPELTTILPRSGLVPGSIKYFRGPLSLFNNYQLFSQGAFPMKEGVRGDYRDGGSLFIFSFQDVAESGSAFDRMNSLFRSDPLYAKVEFIGREDLRAETENQTSVFSFRRNRFIILVTGTDSVTKALSLVDGIKTGEMN